MPTTIRELADLCIARIDGQWFDVFKANVPDTPPNAYTTFYPGVGNVHHDNIATANRMRWTGRFVCSGRGPAQTLDVADAVRSRMLGWQPWPSDRAGDRFFEIDEDAPLLPDETVPNDLRFSLTLTYRIYTNRS